MAHSPPYRVGVLGGGQLGRMLGLAGIPLGVRFHFLEPAEGAPAAAVGETIPGEYHDLRALDILAERVEVVTYEFENVPASATERLHQRRTRVLPPPQALGVAQDRLLEKERFLELDIPTPEFRPAATKREVWRAAEEMGLPLVLKTRTQGYDGKGQRTLRIPEDVPPAWEALKNDRGVLVERFIPFQRELSLVALRTAKGEFRAYPLVENLHENGILVRTLAPAPHVTPSLQEEAEEYVQALMKSLDYVGILALEFFQWNGQLLANEFAPRVHNTGHWTQDGAGTSQFENHLRAILDLPPGPTHADGYTVMFNLLGRLPSIDALLREPLARVHLYDKEPRPGRKLGHVNITGREWKKVEAAAKRVEALVRRAAGTGI